MNIKRYCVIKESDLGVMVAKTTELLSGGWVVIGGVAVGSEQIEQGKPRAAFYCQAMVLPRTQAEALKEIRV